MNASRSNPWSTWKTTILGLAIATASPTAMAAAVAVEPIPTMLVATDDPTGYPDPVCSKCKIIVVEDEASQGAHADVRIAYPGEGPGFEGLVTLTVWLESGEYRTVWLSDVSLAPGDEVELVAAAGTDWSWETARFVWLRFVPT